MELADLIDHVGEPLFAQACEWAWLTAADCGTSGQPRLDPPGSEQAQQVPHELQSLIWETPFISGLDRLELLFVLYRCMPAYGTLMYPKHHFPRWSGPDKACFWAEYRRLICDADERLARPVAYSLWCDFFEDAATVEEAWAGMARRGTLNVRGLKRLLEVAGPVPYALKAELYERLVPDPRWHPAIARSLLFSAKEYFGQLDRKAARSLMSRLALPEPAPEVAQFMQELWRR